MRVCVCVCVVLTNAVVPEVSCQTLSLVLWVVLPLPGLVLFTGQPPMLRLPLGEGGREGGREGGKHRYMFNKSIESFKQSALFYMLCTFLIYLIDLQVSCTEHRSCSCTGNM